MKSFPSRFNLEKNRKIGAAPFWILKCPFPSTGTVYLSDDETHVPSWNGGITTKSWVKSWGSMSENITNDLALVALSSFTLDAIIDQFGYPSLRTILDTAANNVESTDCELYLAFRDIIDRTDAPPQLMWKGNITDFKYVDEQNVSLVMNDVSVRLDKHVGTKVDTITWPDAHPDDVGKIYPIVYGPDNLVEALRVVWGARTTLMTQIGIADTTAYISDGTGLPGSGSIWADDERIGYGSITITQTATAKTYRLNSLTRGMGGTTAAAHAAGAQVWEYKSSYESVIAEGTLGAIKGIFAAIGSDLLQVTDGVSVTVADGLEVLYASQNITVKTAAATLGIQDSIAVDDGIAVTGPAPHSHSAPASSKRYGTASSHSALQGTYYNSFVGADLNLRDGSDVTSLKATGTANNMSDDTAYLTVTFPAYSGPAATGVYAIITHQSFRSIDYPANPRKARVYCGATELDASNTKVTQRIYLGTTVPTSVSVIADHPGHTSNYELTAMVFEIELEVETSTTSLTSLDVEKTGTVTKSGGVALTGGVSTSVRMVDRFVVLADGYRDNGSGSWTGTPNSVIQHPDHVVRHFLFTHAGVANLWSNLSSVGAASSYAFSLVISGSSYNTLKSWLAKMAWECRCYFRFAPTGPQLIVRQTPASQKTVTDSQIQRSQDGRTSLRIARSPLEQVINKVQVHYNRDGTKSGADSYRSVTAMVTDTASIARYGEYERPELMNLDFVRDSAMATSIRDFYLAAYKDRKRTVEAGLFLDNSELEFADSITISLGNGTTCVAEVQSANLEPGSARDGRNDKITLTAREY
jgi:hypothetical protein